MLALAAPTGTQYTRRTDAKGVGSAWCRLADKGDLLHVAALLKNRRRAPVDDHHPAAQGAARAAGAQGRRDAATSTDLFGGVPQDGKTFEVSYHFDLDGDTLTVVAYVPHGGARSIR